MLATDVAGALDENFSEHAAAKSATTMDKRLATRDTDTRTSVQASVWRVKVRYALDRVLRPLFLRIALLVNVVSACHRPNVVERVPISQPMSRYRSASIHLTARQLPRERVEEIAEDMTDRLKQARIFTWTNPPWSAADLEIRVTLMDFRDRDQVVASLVVELLAQHGARRVGEFEVITSSAGSGTGVHGGSGFGIALETREWRAYERGIVDMLRHLQSHRGSASPSL
jgi:hypothetical protein